jgi:DNA invertase Pin-like site-specific DNA recombinase
MLKAIGYTHVASDCPAEKAVGTKLQKARIEVFSGSEPSEIPVKGRAKARDAIQLAHRNRAVLVVYSLSRFSRDLNDALRISGGLERDGGGLVALREQVDTSCDAGRLLFRMLDKLFEFQREVKFERTLDPAASKRAHGQICAAPAPFGYRLVGPWLEPDPDQQAALRKIEHWRREGEELDFIAGQLRLIGHRSFYNEHDWDADGVRHVMQQARETAEERARVHGSD